jgi:hypothetical protein
MTGATQALGDVPFEPADDPLVAATVFTCPLCGGRFTHGGQVCGACPLTRGCDLVRCPHCSYAFPRSSRLVDWFRRRVGAGWRSR